MVSRLELILTAAAAAVIIILASVVLSVVLYAEWWNAHFACVQYRPF